MHGPYRAAAAPPDVPADEPARDPESLATYVLLSVLGAVRLAPACAAHERFGGEVTVALLLAVAGLAGLGATWLRR